MNNFSTPSLITTMNPEKIGMIFIGLDGFSINAQERKWLEHPMVAGVILFTRNYKDRLQLRDLCAEIHAINPELLISVDQEGGRVQRFKEGFTLIPAMRKLGEVYAQNPQEALQLAQSCGFIIAAELNAVGVDFSFAPVCDIDYQRNSAIGNRAFSNDVDAVCALNSALYQGLKIAGSVGVAKHFPGHGFTEIDTHLATPTDQRDLVTLEAQDLRPFRHLIEQGIEALMPAHIIYSCLDAENTVLNSEKWMNYLRRDLGFSGVLISDDMNMKGSDIVKGLDEADSDRLKALRCFESGIELLLCCNQKSTIANILAAFECKAHPNQALKARLQGFKNTHKMPFNVQEHPEWQKHYQIISDFIK